MPEPTNPPSAPSCLTRAAVAGVLGYYGPGGVLVVLVAINTLIGFLQEYRAEKTMEALEKLVAPTCQAYRNRALGEIDSRALVVGDIVRLTEGVSVPADVRLIETTAFSTNEFALTGESDPTSKYSKVIHHAVPVAERHTMASAATTVAPGQALGGVGAAAGARLRADRGGIRCHHRLPVRTWAGHTDAEHGRGRQGRERGCAHQIGRGPGAAGDGQQACGGQARDFG